MATVIAFPQALPISLAGELDEAMVALTTFDVEGLEAMERRIETVTAAHLARCSEPLPELLEKHALLGRLLDVTAANLRVLVSVLQLEPRTERR
jgi:hypothetical protein